MQAVFTSWKVWVAGLLSWAIPFFGSFPFYDPVTGLMIPLIFFKSIMVVFGALCGTALLVWVFRALRPSLAIAVTVGCLWLGINWALDVVALLPMAGMEIGTWFTDIGLRYLTIPIIATGMGFVANR
ncbi:MAG: hypothetical protein KKH72_13970 [Alphaproteobacteria bacterium]|nr:hypothetical protein [Alphaproteobacteria bacterium]